MKTKDVLGWCLLALLAIGCDTTSSSLRESFVLDEEIASDGLARTYQVYVPSTYRPGERPALILALHGAPGTGEAFRAYTGLDRLSEKMGAVIAYPDATSDWAEGCNGCAQADREGIDDIQFMADMVEDIDARVTVDTSRIFVLGYSQGGLFAQRLACEWSERLAAVAVVAATMSGPQAVRCQPEHAVPMLIMHGKRDSVFPYQGSENGNFTTLSAENAMKVWVEANGCELLRRVDREPAGTEGGDVWMWRYTTCAADAEVRLYTMERGSHDWPRGFDAMQVFVDFFDQHQNRRMPTDSSLAP